MGFLLLNFCYFYNLCYNFCSWIFKYEVINRYMHNLYIYIYIYIERERERERENFKMNIPSSRSKHGSLCRIDLLGHCYIDCRNKYRDLMVNMRSFDEKCHLFYASFFCVWLNLNTDDIKSHWLLFIYIWIQMRTEFWSY